MNLSTGRTRAMYGANTNTNAYPRNQGAFRTNARGRFRNQAAGRSIAFIILASGVHAHAGAGTPDDAWKKDAARAIHSGLSYFASSQGPEGAWRAFDQPHPAITSLAVKALAQDTRYGPDHPTVTRGLAFVLRHVQPDGGIYVADEGMRNYHTSVALMALAAVKNPAHKKTVGNAQRFLKQLQWDEGEGHERSSPWYGGVGYGRHKRPDLSNTQLMIEALKQSGLSDEDPVYRKALTFVARCQMSGAHNDQPFAAESVDGGFIYSPANGGESKAGLEMVHGRPRLRSYGSMTYAGFKSLLYAGLSRDDERVRQALNWIQANYTLRHNPNMPLEKSEQGLYYYYHAFSQALHAWGEPVLIDSAGVPHPWRKELCHTLVALQRDDGSWVNQSDRWYEGNPHLVTAYAVLALQTSLTTPGNSDIKRAKRSKIELAD